MVPTSGTETGIIDTLAVATSATFSLAYKLIPIGVPFTPGEDMSALVPGDAVDAAILAGIAVGAAARTPARDPSTGAYIIDFPPPAGGFQEISGESLDYPVTVYGWVQVQEVEGDYVIPDGIMGSVLFTDPVLLTTDGQLFVYGDVSYRFNVGAWF
jgi:hypothetical protein